jgi:hypothetical protein
MKPIVVNGVDGREWTVTSRVDWQQPALGDTFEHDVSSNSGTVWVFTVLIACWTVIVSMGVYYQPVIPWFFWLAAVVITGFFPIRWYFPRSLVAETLGDAEYPAERWVGSVRGLLKRREEMRIVVRRLRTQGTPGHADSPLQPAS